MIAVGVVQLVAGYGWCSRALPTRLTGETLRWAERVTRTKQLLLYDAEAC